MAMEKKSILIVDDEEDLTWSISRHLSKNGNGLDVKCASSGNSALDILKERRFDLIISDIRMPGISGLDLLSRVSETYPGVKVIIMTAFGSEVLEDQVQKLGTQYYIEKPFELRYLRKLVFEALQLSENDVESILLNEQIRDTISVSCRAKLTSRMMFKNGQKNGNVYLQGGEIVHAECGEVEGERALFRILDWDQAYYAKVLNQLAAKRTIRRRWQSLLNATMID